MKIVAGIGNYPSEYHGTRHNVGYDFAEFFRFSVCPDAGWKKNFGARYFMAGPMCFVNPMEYMNLSGRSLKKFSDYYKVAVKDILVVHDDLSLETGTMKISCGKGSGGHNGIESIIYELETRDFYRLRIGIRYSGYESLFMKDYVLSLFSAEELRIILDKVYPEAVSVVKEFIIGNIVRKMNEVNRKKQQ